uniref:Uncharacterized protein n=1 Tax=Oryza meridionalis TaxID=40149 RepID=A0A0E0DTL3_9ORYZ
MAATTKALIEASKETREKGKATTRCARDCCVADIPLPGVSLLDLSRDETVLAACAGSVIPNFLVVAGEDPFSRLYGSVDADINECVELVLHWTVGMDRKGKGQDLIDMLRGKVCCLADSRRDGSMVGVISTRDIVFGVN